MFSFFRNSQPRRPPAAMAAALISDGLPPGMEPSTLSVLQRQGSYSGRRVSYFRTFDPIRVAERGLRVRQFTDLDAHPELVLGSGHIEADGRVVLSQRQTSQVTEAPIRSRADRSAHADDQQVVFPPASSA